MCTRVIFFLGSNVPSRATKEDEKGDGREEEG
jgi:hypothetical protein